MASDPIFQAMRAAANPPLRAWIDSHADAVHAVMALVDARKPSTLEAVIAAKHADLAAMVYRQLRRTFDDAVALLGPQLRGVYNHDRFARVWRETMGKFVERVDATGSFLRDRDRPYAFDDAKARAYADAYATVALQELFDKLVAKVGALDEPHAEGMSGLHFIYAGKRDGHRVRVEQNVTVNVSSRGKLFNQFPARIYVDGKFTSEAEYKRRFA